MCDVNWSSRGRELESLEQSWREFEDLARWLKRCWFSRDQTPKPATPEAEASGKPQPITG